MWEYTDKMMKYFNDPKNVGEIKDPDAEGTVGNIVCGDALRLTLRIDGDTEIITDAKFQTFGCASAIASSSVLTEMVKGKTVEEASKITNKEIADFLGGLPPEKMHCSVMGMEALEKALAGYRGQEKDAEEGEVVCRCFNVTREKIIRAIEENDLSTVKEVTDHTKAGGGCGECKGEIQKILDDHLKKGKSLSKGKKKKKPLSNLQKVNLVQKIVEKQIRPALQADGGDIELVDVEGDKVFVRFLGRCLKCSASEVTIKSVVEKKLREFVSEDITVEEGAT